METRRGQENSGPPTDFLGMMLRDQSTNPGSIVDDALIANQCLLQLWDSHHEVTGLLSSWVVQLASLNWNSPSPEDWTSARLVLPARNVCR